MPTYTSKRNGIYYFKRRIAGRVVFQSLQTREKAAAIARARLLSNELDAGRWEKVFQVRARREVATIGEVLAAYAAALDLGLVARVQRENAQALRRLVRVGLGVEAVDDLPCTVLDGPLVRKYQLARLAGAGPTEAARNSAAVAANSCFLQAKSVFARHVLGRGVYRELNLGATIAEFCGHAKLPTLPTDNYTPPPAELLARVWSALPDLERADPAAWMAFWMAAMTGLRRGEICAARWRWIGEHEVSVSVEVDWSPKSGRRRPVPVVPRLRVEALRVATAAGWDTGPDDQVLPGTRKQQEKVFTRLGRWMRGLGWDRKKKAHELRAVFATQLCLAAGPYAAQLALGHSKLETTTRYAARPTVAAVDPGAVAVQQAAAG